ncbi:unnamed protein product, partial [marine sediment metagenome]
MLYVGILRAVNQIASADFVVGQHLPAAVHRSSIPGA